MTPGKLETEGRTAREEVCNKGPDARTSPETTCPDETGIDCKVGREEVCNKGLDARISPETACPDKTGTDCTFGREEVCSKVWKPEICPVARNGTEEMFKGGGC